jgi:hypothetical protein
MEKANVKQEINKYKKFKKVDGATYRKVNQFLRKRTYITAREWALARLCTDFRTSGGAEMTFIGKHLPELVPFMEETYSPQAVNQARNSFKKKVRKASATFFYGAMCGFFTTDELDDLLFEASEVARFLLEVEGTTLDIDEEIDIEDRITNVMRSVGEAAKTILKTRSEEIDLTTIQIHEGHNIGTNNTPLGTLASPKMYPVQENSTQLIPHSEVHNNPDWIQENDFPEPIDVTQKTDSVSKGSTHESTLIEQNSDKTENLKKETLAQNPQIKSQLTTRHHGEKDS